MRENPDESELQRAAADPATPQVTLADIAYEHPALRPAVALNPSTYEGLLDWLRDLNDSDVDIALAKRSSSSETPDEVSPAAAPEPAVPVAPELIAPEMIAPGLIAPWKFKPLSRRRIALIAGIVVVAGLVAGAWYSYAASIEPHGSNVAESAASSVSSATDYRFGAKQTWQTKVKVVAAANDGYAAGAANIQTYPGLWLVSWPGDDSGSGRLASETLLGMDPATGSVKWSMSPGPYACASSLTAGALACVDTSRATLSILDPSTGKATGSSLNNTGANSVYSYQGDIVVADESATASGVTDTLARINANGTTVWKKSGSCSSSLSNGEMQVAANDELAAAKGESSNAQPHEALIQGTCLQGTVNLDSGVIDTTRAMDSDGCVQSSPFDDSHGEYSYSGPCVSSNYPVLVARGSSTITAVTYSTYASGNIGSDVPTVWSADLPGASLSGEGYPQDQIAHLGAYALVGSAGHLYGVDTAHGPTWEQSDAFSADGTVLLLPIDVTKPNTPVLALDLKHDTIQRLDPGFGASRVSVQPATLPSCPKGMTPVSFSTWDKGKGATLVCQGFANTVDVVLIVDGKTYTSSNGSVTPTGFRADFGGGVSVDIGLGGWTVWVGNGGTTTLHAASSGWQSGDVRVRTMPPLSSEVQACPSGTYALSLSSWNGGWLLTCGRNATATTRFVYVDGSVQGSGQAMTAQGGQSCGTDTAGRQVCVSANPAVVTFSPKGEPPTQHSVDSNYVVGTGFSGAGKGTGAYGLADPRATAASQVAYLNGILQQSQAARSSVMTVVQNILKCASVQADVDNAQAVVADRTTELQALNSAPVDAIPGGVELVAQLQAVLRDSLTADQAYVTAAGQVASGQCAAGISTYSGQKALIGQITNEKTVFSNAWNAQIAPQYGTPTYTQDDI